MLALIGNLSVLEIVLIAVVAVLVFGRNLPKVAGQAAAQFMKAKRALSDLRRETGIDDELRRAREVVYEAAREASTTRKKQGPVPPPGEPRSRPAPRLVPPEPPPKRPSEPGEPTEPTEPTEIGQSDASTGPRAAPREADEEPDGEPARD